MQVHDAARIRRAMLLLASAAFLWSIGIALTGGFYVRVAGVRISSRDPADALAIAIPAALAALALSPWRAALRRLIAAVRRRSSAVAAALRTRVAMSMAERRREPWLPLAPAAGIAIGGALVVLLQLARTPPLWVDEEMILLNVRDRPWSGLGGTLWLGQSAPLGWLFIERAALVGLGSGEAALRLLPALFGIGTIGAAFAIGRRWLGPAGSAVLVLLCAFGPYVSHYLFETKHYSADAFFALLLPALAVWAVEDGGPASRAARALVWWTVAAAGQLLANGALLVAPACALYLIAATWRREGVNAAVRVALAGVVWLAAFGANYYFSLRYTHENEFLRRYWSNEIPPASAGFVDTVRWIAARIYHLAHNPVGTVWWKTMWACAAIGLALARPRRLGLVFAAVPLTAFLLAGLRLVPLYERFVIWIVPALYVGLAAAAARAGDAIRDADRGRRWLPALLATALLVATTAASADIYFAGSQAIRGRRAAHSKHSVNDREAVAWLMARVQPGDAIVTTRLGWPAVWWYGDISIAQADADGVVRHSDGVALLEAEHVEGEAECSGDPLREALEGHRRVAVYLGFRDLPPGFDHLLLHALDRAGAIVAFSRYSDLGVAAVVDLHDANAAELTLHELSERTARNAMPPGCVRLRPARRW